MRVCPSHAVGPVVQAGEMQHSDNQAKREALANHWIDMTHRVPGESYVRQQLPKPSCHRSKQERNAQALSVKMHVDGRKVAVGSGRGER